MPANAPIGQMEGLKPVSATNYLNHAVEMALAHAIGDKVEASYRHGDLFAKRVRLMADWAKFCSQPTVSGGVIPLRKASR